MTVRRMALPEMLVEEFPEVKVIRGDGNLWWTAATNLGVQYALDQGATYILVLNDDTLAPPDMVASMWEWSRKEPLAVMGALEVSHETRLPVYAGLTERVGGRHRRSSARWTTRVTKGGLARSRGVSCQGAYGSLVGSLRPSVYLMKKLFHTIWQIWILRIMPE